MKREKLFLAAAVCLAFSPVKLSAQADGIFGMGMNYAPTELISKTEDDSHSMEMNTINVNFFDLTIPMATDLCLDMGFDFLSTWGDKKKNGITNKTSLYGMEISGGFSYMIDVDGDLVSIYPYVDLALDLYLSGKNKVSGKSIDSYETDLFEKGSDYHQAVVNYCFGVKVCFGKVYFGLGRKAPLTNFYNCDDVKQNFYRTEFTIGFNLL